MWNFKGRLRLGLQLCLQCVGKGGDKVSTVFGVNAAAAHEAVLHLRQGAPDVPVWLFTTAAPLPETEALCERIYRGRNSLALLARSQSELWPRWVAISVGTWTGHGAWALKVAPFLIPPFRVLILNADGGFFPGTPKNVLVHGMRAAWDRIQLAWRWVREAHHAFREALHHARVRAQEAMHRFGERVRWKIHHASVGIGDFGGGLARLTGATGLRMAAALLRWTSNPHIAFFHRLRRDQPLMLNVAPSEGDDVVYFRQSGSEWQAEALENAAQSSHARWLLWLSEDASDPVSDSAPLFKDDRTFAASRQKYFRGWKKAIMPTAAFRTLQASEASRVLAPLAAAILVDRKKLLALGIPRCGMAGTAWLILFWKAAAAGWRSYSVGRSSHDDVKEQPEFPIQDTAFVFQVLRDQALRRIAPRQEELSRGNVGFSIENFHPAVDWQSDRLKVLVVSPFLPYPLSHGGAVRIYNLCRALSDRVDFTLIAMREANDQVDYRKLHEVFKEVHVVDKDERSPRDRNLPDQVSGSESRSLRALIENVSLRLLPDVMQIEFTHFAALRSSAPSVPAILVEHDLTFSLYRQLAESTSTPESWREYEKWLAFERKWLETYEGVWTVSENDRIRAMEEGPRKRDLTFAIPNGVDLHRFLPCNAPEGTQEVFYVGSFRHLPNIIGFEKLCGEIMPRVWAKNPDARLRVVAGPDHERYWRQFGRTGDLRALDSRILIDGFVEDLRPLYDRASVVAVPLEVSAGTNIKVLEAMACGKAIVSTPVGCAGLELHDGYDIAIRKEWPEFSDAVCTLLSDQAFRANLGKRARWNAETNFGWTAIADRAYESYLTVSGRTAQVRTESREERVSSTRKNR